MFGNNRDQLRRQYLVSWQKAREGRPLQPLEQMVARVVSEHPEYHALLESGEAGVAADYGVEMGQSNPFLHMGMHLAIREQLSTDRPAGIAMLFSARLASGDDPLDVEHQMMECLGEAMWSAQHSGLAPDEVSYLHCLQQRLR